MDQYRAFGFAEDVDDLLFQRLDRDAGVDAAQGFEQAACENDLLVVLPFRRLAIGGDLRAVGILIATFPEPVEAELFELVFGNTHQISIFFKILYVRGD